MNISTTRHPLADYFTTRGTRTHLITLEKDGETLFFHRAQGFLPDRDQATRFIGRPPAILAQHPGAKFVIA